MTRAAALALAGLLAACATAPVPRQSLPALAGVPEAFEMTGRMSLRRGDISDIARLRWTHRGAADTWVFASPLGNEVARIESDANGARLEQGGAAPVESAATFSELAQRAVGVALDPSMLVAWLHGSGPAQGEGWQVTIDEAGPAGSVSVAKRLTARRGNVTVRLVVDDYRVLEPAR
ncbi:MAG TPA: outer membrane lipoprotein LolB [Usitatibacter sp.]|nr:outer membrane lipoprotein LolB [Usitatibacter sp.]